MSALAWITAARRAPLATWLRRSRPRKTASRQAVLGLESLERIELLSTVHPLRGLARPAAQLSMSSNMVSITAAPTITASQVTGAQFVNVSPQLTNFTASFSPSINLFDPALGTLKAVHVTAAANLISVIKSQNTSSSSPANITPSISGSFQINGLPAAVGNAFPAPVLPPPIPQPVAISTGIPPFNFTGNTTVIYGFPSDYTNSGEFQRPPVTSSAATSLDFTDPASLAFWTASAGRTTITPQLAVKAAAGATAPNGNLQTDVTTRGGGQIVVTYEYEGCPTIVRLVRFGIHQQPTQLQVIFNGPVNVADAQNTANYRVKVPNAAGSFTGPGVTYIGVNSAAYDAATNSVTLVTAKRLNVHHQFQLEVRLPCNNGNVVVVQFGGKNSLGGFLNPHNKNQFVAVQNGRIVR